MKREIKFRAWDGKKIIYPDYDGWFDKCFLKQYKTLQTIQLTAVLRELTEMQYTGLKDKNGKEIYDGDIVKIHLFTQVLGSNMGVCEGEQELTGIIEIDEMGVYFNCSSNDDSLSGHLVFFSLHEESLEVIGNIYENPELINE